MYLELSGRQTGKTTRLVEFVHQTYFNTEKVCVVCVPRKCDAVDLHEQNKVLFDQPDNFIIYDEDILYKVLGNLKEKRKEFVLVFDDFCQNKWFSEDMVKAVGTLELKSSYFTSTIEKAYTNKDVDGLWDFGLFVILLNKQKYDTYSALTPEPEEVEFQKKENQTYNLY